MFSLSSLEADWAREVEEDIDLVIAEAAVADPNEITGGVEDCRELSNGILLMKLEYLICRLRNHFLLLL